MTEPLPVTIHRPYAKPSELVARLVGFVGAFFIGAWLLMLLVPQFIDLHPGYWTCAAFLAAARVVLPHGATLDSWSKIGSKPKQVKR